MMPKNAQRFSGAIMLQIIGIKRVHDLDEPHPNHERIRCGAAYNMSPSVRSKKIAAFELPSINALTGHCNRKMIRIGHDEAVDLELFP
jgi:hypothetical protein